MATTTNYGWTTPDDTALVKDGAAAIRTLGTSIDTTTKNLNPSTTLGDIEYRSSTANTNTRLGIGTSGQVLTVTGGVPVWETISAGGMTLISTTTLTGASVTLSSIPATYNTLQIVVRLPLLATDAQEINVRMNADATSSRHTWTSNYTSASSNFGQTSWRISGAMDNAVTQGLLTVTIRDYANTSTWKLGNWISVTNNETTTTNPNIQMGVGVYNQTSAISSLQFIPQSGNFTSGTVLLYGVK